MSDTTQDGSQSEGPLGERDDAGLLAKILETSLVGITVVDAEGQIFFANRKAEEILGLTKSEINSRVYNDPEWRITTFDGGHFPDEELPFQKVRDTGKAVEDVRHAIVWPDGRTVCLSINASPLTDAGGGFAGMVTSLEDVTEAVETERALLQRQNRAYKVLSLCNETLIRAADETSLLEEVCRIIVNDGGYRLAWVGYTEKGGGKIVKPVAQCGYEEGYLDVITITWDETDTGQGPTGTAIRTGQPAHARNIVSDPAYAPWRDEALKHGYASSLALPMIITSHTLGALNIYATEPDAFDPEEERLLLQMAGDLAYGITTLRAREERKKNLVKLTESESRYRTLVEHAADGIFIIDSRGKYVDVNQSGLNMLGYSRNEMLEMHVTDIVSRNDMEQTPIKLDLLLAGETLTTERELVRKDGSIVPVELSTRMMPNGDILGIQRDISVRKLAERELHDSREDWRRIFNSISDPVMILDLDQNILAANPAAEKNL